MIIGFVGNCQMVTLCYYTQQLLKDHNHEIRWVCYNYLFLEHFDTENRWGDKCVNKIYDTTEGIEFIKKCDIIFYQKIRPETSQYFNFNNIITYNKYARFISMPSIKIDLKNVEESLKKLRMREVKYKHDICITSIFKKHTEDVLLLSHDHPTTFLFMEIMKKICKFLNVPFFKNEQYQMFMSNNNYMGLP
jgi:hypothetical protein